VPAQMKRIPGYGKKQGDNYDLRAEGDRAMTQLKVIHPRKHAAQATARRSRPEETRRHRGNDQSQHDRAVHGPAAYSTNSWVVVKNHGEQLANRHDAKNAV